MWSLESNPILCVCVCVCVCGNNGEISVIPHRCARRMRIKDVRTECLGLFLYVFKKKRDCRYAGTRFKPGGVPPSPAGEVCVSSDLERRFSGDEEEKRLRTGGRPPGRLDGG